MDRHLWWVFDSESNLIASNLNNGDNDIVPKDNALAYLPGDDKHDSSL